MGDLGNARWKSVNFILRAKGNHWKIWDRQTEKTGGPWLVQHFPNLALHQNDQHCLLQVLLPGLHSQTSSICISRDVARKLYSQIFFPGDSWAPSLALVQEMEFGNHCFTNKCIPQKLFVHGDFISEPFLKVLGKRATWRQPSATHFLWDVSIKHIPSLNAKPLTTFNKMWQHVWVVRPAARGTNAAIWPHKCNTGKVIPNVLSRFAATWMNLKVIILERKECQEDVMRIEPWLQNGNSHHVSILRSQGKLRQQSKDKTRDSLNPT